MTDTQVKCARCGKPTGDHPRLLPIDGTARCAEVCTPCFIYLSEDDEAYGRFVVLDRAIKRQKEKHHD